MIKAGKIQTVCALLVMMSTMCSAQYEYNNYANDNSVTKYDKMDGYSDYGQDAYGSNYDPSTNGMENNQYSTPVGYIPDNYNSQDTSYVYTEKTGSRGPKGSPGNACYIDIYSPPYPDDFSRERLNRPPYVWSNSFRHKGDLLGILDQAKGSWFPKDNDKADAYWQMNFEQKGDKYNLRIMGVVTEGSDTSRGYPNYVKEFEVEYKEKNGQIVSLGKFNGNSDLETKRYNWFAKTVYDPSWLRIRPTKCGDKWNFNSRHCRFAMRSAVMVKVCRGDDTDYLRDSGYPPKHPRIHH